jgi:hypothetical protein
MDALFARARACRRSVRRSRERVIGKTTTRRSSPGSSTASPARSTRSSTAIRGELGARRARRRHGGPRGAHRAALAAISKVDAFLTLAGLRLVWERNHRSRAAAALAVRLRSATMPSRTRGTSEFTTEGRRDANSELPDGYRHRSLRAVSRAATVASSGAGRRAARWQGQRRRWVRIFPTARCEDREAGLFSLRRTFGLWSVLPCPGRLARPKRLVVQPSLSNTARTFELRRGGDERRTREDGEVVARIVLLSFFEDGPTRCALPAGPVAAPVPDAVHERLSRRARGVSEQLAEPALGLEVERRVVPGV